ncbi:hemolysin III family protein [Salmonella enterica subsp. enterica]|nr:hemolysin III family protein [Salmonella enterica subsp. enterica serovar Newport]ECO3272978.1 hemolysin III family protein [Salmonella enterica subsp. enterica serovar Newport]EED5999134.1 hemolysin III family protein [Salmonella enterica subsp. enterica serovar Newport]EJR4751715.1 hemolysin III family protein [Salmonella enterica subsp. enterica serovar Newport]
MVQKPLMTQGYSLAEEIANSISHGIGLVFGIVGLVLLLVQAVEANAGMTAIASYSLYGGSMILLFLASTLYHAIPHQRAKIWLKKFDHCAIYLLIAGTYTPFLLVGLDSPLAVGGVVYSLGVIFYVCKRIPYNHAIWHGFVLGGSVCHFLAIYLYVGQA